MLLSRLSLASFAIGACALPSTQSYAVKERHAVPRAWTKVGDSVKDDVVHLQIGLKQSNPGAVEKHLEEISNPSHSRYRQHLSAAEVHDLIAPSAETQELVEAWLMEHDITTAAYNPAKDWIHVIIPIEKAESLLQTKYSVYEHADGTTVSRAPVWSLPAHLHEHIDVVQPTTSFFTPRKEAVRFHPDITSPSHSISWWQTTGQYLYGASAPAGVDPTSAAAVAAVCNASFVTLKCLQTVYGTVDYTPKVPEQGSVAICDYLNETNYRADIKKYLDVYLPAAAGVADTFAMVNIANASNDQGPYTAAQITAEDNIEGNLDAELVLGLANPIPMTAFLTGGSPPFVPDLNTPTDTNEPYLTFLNYALAQDTFPKVLSSSYGDDEQSVPQSYADRACAGFAQLGLMGTSVIFSSGDDGVGADGTCYSNVNNQSMFIPNFPASCPWVTTVGATGNFNPETAVSRFGSGGGFSNYFAAPSYQRATVEAYIAGLGSLYAGLYNTTGRGYPDVSAQGNHDVIVWAGNISTVGGTSASAPTFAGVIALVNDALLAKGERTLGFLNPWIYSGAYKAFTDITIGSSIGCDTAGFPAQTGWDAVTGWGTPDFGKLVKAAIGNFSSSSSHHGGW